MTKPTTSALLLIATLAACNNVPEEMAEDEVPVDGEVVAVGDFIDEVHPTSGQVEVVEDAEEGTLSLVMTDFLSDNGPDLFVYLATDTTASDVIDLGALRATSGTLNYEIPDGAYEAKYDHVLIWCDQFSVLFGSAQLAPPGE